MNKIKYYGFKFNLVTGDFRNLKIEITDRKVYKFENIGDAYALRFTDHKKYKKAKKIVLNNLKNKKRWSLLKKI